MFNISSRQPSRITEATPGARPTLSKVGADIFVCGGKDDIVVTDYYSLYPEVCRLYTTTAETVIASMKARLTRLSE